VTKKKAAGKKPEAKKPEAKKPEAKKPEAKPPEAESQVPAKIDGDASWTKEIAKLKEQRDRVSGGILSYRYATGIFALAVATERAKEEGYRKHGNHTLIDIAVELAEADSTVYACMKFASQTSPEQLAHMIERNWAWRAVASLVTVEDPKERKHLQNEYEKAKFPNSDAFKDAVRDHNSDAKTSGERTEKRGGGAGSTASKVKGFTTVSATFVARTVPEFVAGIEAFIKEAQDMSPKTADIVTEHIKAAKATLPELRQQLTQVEAAIKKTGL